MNMKESTKRENKVIKYILFLINPFFGFFATFGDLKSKSSYVIFLSFSVLFGICFSVPSGRTADFTGDGAVYRYRFDRMAEQSNDDFEKVYNEYIQFEEGEKDFYVTAVSYVTSRFTANYHWVFAVFAFVFSFFMLKSFRFLTEEKDFTNSFYCFILAIIFIMSNSIFNINGVRFWTAAWIGVYCIFQIFVNRDNKYFLLALITPFVHVSFFVYLLILVLAYFSKKSNAFWFVMFLISFFVANFTQDLLKASESYFPAFISRTISLYTDQNIINQRNEDTLWYVKIFSFLESFMVNFMVILFYKNRALFLHNKRAYNLFLFLIVWMTFVNFSSAIPSLGGRFIQMSLPLIAYLWLIVFIRERRYQNLLVFFLIAFSIDFIYALRSILKVTEIDFYISSPLYLLYHYLL
ncbi:EpsG family protein [Sphingobacterium faecium]|uniref:EpsG family protein n=1 Tax=Sphingobacterium faecium TaxID=34087 RepID=UPI0024690B91|nr:EpsG family protein [Sphingobacterium faecium]MDH5828696.1 EpsG family protein [Sphingobacterium faecium]